jgi:hypothetical protein
MQELVRTIKEHRDSVLIDQLRIILGKSDASKKSISDITDLLSELDPSLDSFAYLFILDAALDKHYDKPEALLSSMYLTQFATFCGVAGSNSSAPIQREYIYRISRAITNACTQTRSLPHILAAARAICSVLSSSCRMRDSICQLHVDALQLTLLGAALSPPHQKSSILQSVLPIMASDILFACEEPLNPPLRPLHIQEHVFAYFYYSGCIFCGLSDFDAATDRLFLCVSAGTQQRDQRDTHFGRESGLFGREHVNLGSQIHEIIEAAHKKLILACLLCDGDDISWFKQIPVSRLAPYDSLVSAFSTCWEKSKGSLEGLRQVIARHHSIFLADGNADLVMQLQDAYLLQAIRAQSRTHVAVDVLQLCVDLHLPDSVKIPDCVQALITQASLVLNFLSKF